MNRTRQQQNVFTSLTNRGSELPVVTIPADAEHQDDSDRYTNRYEMRSSKSGKLYLISQSKKLRHWECSCTGWINHKNCYHLRELGLPSKKVPYECRLIQPGKGDVVTGRAPSSVGRDPQAEAPLIRQVERQQAAENTGRVFLDEV